MTPTIGPIGSTSMKVEAIQENVALNVFTMTLVISMLTFMHTVCMGDGHILEIRLFHGQTMFQFTTKRVFL